MFLAFYFAMNEVIYDILDLFAGIGGFRLVWNKPATTVSAL